MYIESQENKRNFSVKKDEKDEDYLLSFSCYEVTGRVHVNPNIEKFFFDFAKYALIIEEEFD